MAAFLRLTETIARATTTGDRQPLYTAVDVLAYDELDLLVTAAFEAPSGTTGLYLDLFSGMQTATEDGWIKVGNTSPQITLTTRSVAWSFNAGFFRYIRWQVNSLTGATAVRFSVEVVGRKNA